MELLLKIPYDEGITKSEDMWLGHVMGQQGIVPFHDSRYDHCSMRGGVSLHNNNITNHLFTHYGHYVSRSRWGSMSSTPEVAPSGS